MDNQTIINEDKIRELQTQNFTYKFLNTQLEQKLERAESLKDATYNALEMEVKENARLKQENERLKAEIEELNELIRDIQNEKMEE